MELLVEETNLPRYVIFRGRKVRIISYLPANAERGARFIILDTDDTERSVPRSAISFIK